MEVNHKKEDKGKILTNGFYKVKHIVDYQIITSIEFNANNVSIDNILLPKNLVRLNLSHSSLNEVPAIILNLEKLKNLDLSYNQLEYFDEVPKFYQTIERLDLSHNRLRSPPNWIWLESPQNLTHLNLSCNSNITELLKDGCMELLEYTTEITEVDLHNCKLDYYTKLLATFPKAKIMSLGTKEICHWNSNLLTEAPCEGLEQCCDIERLNLCNTQLFSVSADIQKFINLIQIDLSQNSIGYLPNEFCTLTKLEECVLSCNKLLYLPDDMCKLLNLKVLRLDGNELCVLPDNICVWPKLETLDLYDNHLNEVPDNYECLEELDVALNYVDEPQDEEYVKKKLKLRLSQENRCDGRKIEIEQHESDYTPCSSDSECFDYFNNTIDNHNADGTDSDWESDDHWIPCPVSLPTQPRESPWLFYAKKKMAEGHFCPMDAHIVPISEKIKYQKMCNPELNYESDGQFDDLTDDD